MAHTIQREEAELENSLREKDLLLARGLPPGPQQPAAHLLDEQHADPGGAADETKRTLRRLQDRIMAMSTIHAALYQAPALSKIRADDLVVTLARQVAPRPRAAPTSTSRRTSARSGLYPDLAVPLALLTVEAVTNATKHLGRPADGGAPWIEVGLTETDGLVRLDVETASGRTARPAPAPSRAGSDSN